MSRYRFVEAESNPRSSVKGSRVLIHLMSLLASAAVALMVAECLLRVLDVPPSDFSPWVELPDTGFGYAPSLSTRLRRVGEYDVAFATNREGLRDDEIAAKSGTRILLIGDSFASGYGVERGEMFADLLERDLETEVVNAGVGGYEIVHQVHYYRSRGRDLEPDLVVYALYLGNDLSRNREWGETENGGLKPIGRRLPVRDSAALKLRALLDSYYYGRRLQADDRRQEWEPFSDYLAMCERTPSETTEDNWRAVERVLEQLRDEIYASGARFLVVTFSYATANDPAARVRYETRHPDFVASHDFLIPRRRTAEILERLGIDFIELDDAIARHYENGGEPLYFARDGHWNAAGHRFVAKTLAEPVRAALGGGRHAS